MSDVKVKYEKPVHRVTGGLFIAVEGVDGAGKTTNIKYIEDYIRYTLGFDIVTTREPGGTPFAEKIRSLLFDPGSKDVSHTAQALLVNAARRDHVDRVIKPHMAKGSVVISDRFYLSTMVYQPDADNLHDIIRIGSSWTSPDFTLIFDVDPETSLKRKGNVTDQNWLDQAKVEEIAARRKVLSDYAIENRFKTAVIDGTQSIQAVRNDIQLYLDNYFEALDRAGRVVSVESETT